MAALHDTAAVDRALGSRIAARKSGQASPTPAIAGALHD
jgi:hypothetical protein